MYLLILTIGLALCTDGFKVFNFLQGLCGFLLGAGIGYTAGLAYGDEGIAIIFAIIVGILFSALARKFYLLCLFLNTSILGGLVTYSMLIFENSAESAQASAILVGIVLGVIVVVLNKPAIIIVTAFIGAALLSELFFNSGQIIWTIIFTAIGALVQFENSKPKVTKTTKSSTTAPSNTVVENNTPAQTSTTIVTEPKVEIPEQKSEISEQATPAINDSTTVKQTTEV